MFFRVDKLLSFYCNKYIKVEKKHRFYGVFLLVKLKLYIFAIVKHEFQPCHYHGLKLDY